MQVAPVAVFGGAAAGVELGEGGEVFGEGHGVKIGSPITWGSLVEHTDHEDPGRVVPMLRVQVVGEDR